MNRKALEGVRDCVKNALNVGCQNGDEFHKMRHAIVVELTRIGYTFSEIKDALLKWNRKNERPLGISEQNSKLLGYVDWAAKKTCRTSCETLKDYCIDENKCQFHLRTTARNRQATQELPFDLTEASTYLEKRFKSKGHILLTTLKVLRFIQQERATGEIIIIGHRGIATVIRDRYKYRLNAMEVHRNLLCLMDEGMIEKAVQGKGGMFSNKANGYRFLPWRRPPLTSDSASNIRACPRRSADEVRREL